MKMLTEEGHSFTSVQQSMIIRKSDDHDWPNNNFPVYNHRLLLYRVHACGTNAHISSRNKWKADSAPKTAACGKLMIGVPYREPNTPPLELVHPLVSPSTVHRWISHGKCPAGHIL